MKPGHKRSAVWNYFTKIDDKTAVCSLCSRYIKCYSGTTNLRQHIMRVHRKQSLETLETEQVLVDENSEEILLEIAMPGEDNGGEEDMADRKMLEGACDGEANSSEGSTDPLSIKTDAGTITAGQIRIVRVGNKRKAMSALHGDAKGRMSEKKQFESIEKCLKNLPKDQEEFVFRNLYGDGSFSIELPEAAKKCAEQNNFDLQAYGIKCKKEELRCQRIVRVGLFQHKMPLTTTAPLEEQRNAVYNLAREAITTAAESGVNIFCFQELWNMPFAFCTREKLPWCEFAESAQYGPTTKFLQELAKQHNMVIVSSILERDENHNDVIWNAAVVIDNHGDYLGVHRKNHIPRTFDFNESTYYMEGNTGHPVFETEFGKIAINICFGRHHNLNWLMFGLNGAEIVFNPSCTTEWSEPLWPIEARNAAVTNGFYACAINRVGTEIYEQEFNSGNGKPPHKDFGPFYGSSYIAAPDGSRTPGLSRTKNGLLVGEIDLNLCRQMKDQFAFTMTQRLDLYVKSLTKVLDLNYTPQVIRKEKS